MTLIDYPGAIGQILQVALAARCLEVAEYVSTKTCNIVQSGPFAGMTIPEEHSWGIGDRAPKLLGTYEQELHPAIEKAITRSPEAIFNAGSAEGYYAVGLARRLPEVPVYAFDLNPNARRICQQAAELNNTPRVAVKSAFQLLNNFNNALIVMDVEGEEINLLNPEIITYLHRCDVIVECHDFLNPAITETLKRRMDDTHNMEVIYENTRDWSDFPMLDKLCSLDRYLALAEHRPCLMHWLVAWAKERT